ncbi:hypothetical protein [Natronococcus occultus]|uniref:Uncharacterized protein n=1 Tax=Natronococcus occultus SP4 TaxID=694430 RepID=L0K3V3_9EURY|nr:hypothetical protein [Natronococcus occultus]AGB39962.1 hypothetical protein Natoc_4270 [Natronococcus occultus SP4]
MRRRTILGSAGTTLSIALAGCGDVLDADEEGESDANGQSDTDDGNGADDGTQSADTNGPDEDDDLHEDDSIEGEVVLTDAASDVLSTERHTYTWADDPPSDRCYVHVELETVGDEEFVFDAVVRIDDEDGTEITSTRYTEETSPEPGETAVYSLSLTNCEATAAYEVEIDESDESDDADDTDGLLIDDFEEYDDSPAGPWTLDGTGDVEITSSAALHPDSSQGLRQSGDSNVRSFPGQGLPNYPEDGSEVSVLVRPDSDASQPWLLVGMEDDVWSTETSGWRLIVDPSGEIRLGRETGEGVEILDSDSQVPGLVDEIVDCRFVADSDDGFEFRIQDLDGATLGSVSTDETAGIDDEMSVGFRSTDGADWDWPRLVDRD